MARRRRSATRTTIVRTPAPIVRVSAPRARYRRAARRVGGAVFGERARIGALTAAGLLGLAQKHGIAIPTVMGLTQEATVGIIAWAIEKQTRSPWASHVATAALSIAVHQFAKTQSVIGGTAVMYDE